MTPTDAAVICKALGDSNRLRIVQMLAEGEKCGCKLLEAFAFTQPTLSHHMKVLCGCGLVNARKEGKWQHYSLNREAWQSLSAFVEQLEGANDREERSKNIVDACLREESCDPVEIFFRIAQSDAVRIHGPEHHVLDGAALLTAFYNAGGKIDLPAALEEIMKRGLQMPGATCGLWGVCGAVSSIGAALSIIDETGPLSADDSWGKHMDFTSVALQSLSQVGGPRCCKRDAFLSFQRAVEYINENYAVHLESGEIVCAFSRRNEQCIKERCPFYAGEEKTE